MKLFISYYSSGYIVTNQFGIRILENVDEITLSKFLQLNQVNYSAIEIDTAALLKYGSYWLLKDIYNQGNMFVISAPEINVPLKEPLPPLKQLPRGTVELLSSGGEDENSSDR